MKSKLKLIQALLNKKYKFLNEDIKLRKDFFDEETYLIYLTTSPIWGPKTKERAKQRLLNEYPNGVYSSVFFNIERSDTYKKVNRKSQS